MVEMDAVIIIVEKCFYELNLVSTCLCQLNGHIVLPKLEEQVLLCVWVILESPYENESDLLFNGTVLNNGTLNNIL